MNFINNLFLFLNHNISSTPFSLTFDNSHNELPQNIAVQALRVWIFSKSV